MTEKKKEEGGGLVFLALFFFFLLPFSVFSCEAVSMNKTEKRKERRERRRSRKRKEERQQFCRENREILCVSSRRVGEEGRKESKERAAARASSTIAEDLDSSKDDRKYSFFLLFSLLSNLLFWKEEVLIERSDKTDVAAGCLK